MHGPYRRATSSHELLDELKALPSIPWQVLCLLRLQVRRHTLLVTTVQYRLEQRGAGATGLECGIRSQEREIPVRL